MIVLGVCLCMAICVLGNTPRYPDQNSFSDEVMEAVEALPYRYFFSNISCNTISFLYYRPGSSQSTPITVENASTVIPTNSSLKIIINGWLHTGATNWIVKMAEALNNAISSSVVIAVDWSAYSLQDVDTAIRAVKSVGFCTGNLIKDLRLNPKNVHLIEHSLGAQVSSFVANSLGGDQKPYRISGLDPGAPGFEYPYLQPSSRRLTANDADVVDVMHTGIGYRGVVRPCGTVDFYVNEGFPQPGCSGDNIESCSHQYAHVYFTLSISDPTRFSGISVRNNKMVKAHMGYWVTVNFNGIFYVCTNASNVSPYIDL